MKWCHTEVIKFLEGYKSLPCLWNPEHRDYKDRTARDVALETLKNCLAYGNANFTTKDVKDKIKGLRTTYSEELNKIITTKGEYKPKVFWFKLADTFLRGVIEGKKRKFEYPYPENSAGQDQEQHTESNEEYIYNSTSAYTSHTEDIGTSPSSGNVIQSISKDKQEDELDLFGRSIVLQLRKLPELDALDLMQKIQLLINNKKQYLKTEHSIMSTSKRSVNDVEVSVSPLEEEEGTRHGDTEESADEDESFVFRIKTESKDDRVQYADPLSAKRMRL